MILLEDKSQVRRAQPSAPRPTLCPASPLATLAALCGAQVCPGCIPLIPLLALRGAQEGLPPHLPDPPPPSLPLNVQEGVPEAIESLIAAGIKVRGCSLGRVGWGGDGEGAA